MLANIAVSQLDATRQTLANNGETLPFPSMTLGSKPGTSVTEIHAAKQSLSSKFIVSIYKISRVLDIEHGTFTPQILTTTGGMGKECLNYHSRLAQLIAIKKGAVCTVLRSALICLRGTRSTVRKSWDFRNTDIEIENTEEAIY